MNIEPVLNQDEAEQPASQPVPSKHWGFIYGLYVLGMPLAAFWATDLFKPEWQDGKLSSYLILLLSPKASWIFFPLIVFSILSYLSLLSNVVHYSRQFLARIGIYTGALLALQYSILAAVHFFSDNPSSAILLLLWFAPLFVPPAYRWIVLRWGSDIVHIGLVVIVLATIVIFAAMSTFATPFLLILAALTIASPFWCFLIFLRAAIWLLKNSETSISVARGLGIVGWLGAYAVAWRISILKMYELYAALPPQPPADCYIATAAAQGHPQFVGSQIVLRADGKSLRINAQLQLLKCAELALMATHPRVHKMLRQVYDVLGKFLAQSLRNPFLADVAYILLKPFEWSAKFILRGLIPEIDEIAKTIYKQ